MTNSLQISQTEHFKKVYKKLKKNQKQDVNKAIRHIANEPLDGDEKVGDLSGIRIYKFKMNKQPTLLAYCWDGDCLLLTLLRLGTHENFYRDLKKQLKN